MLDPREDPEAYADFDAPPLLDLPDAVPEGIRNRAETEARNAAFGTLLALPGMLSVSSRDRSLALETCQCPHRCVRTANC